VTDSVDTVGTSWAWVVDTFVDVVTAVAVGRESSVALAAETTLGVDTSSIGIAVVLSSSALVDVHADGTVSGETVVAHTAVSTDSVDTGGIVVTLVVTGVAFVDIVTNFSVSKETRFACTRETTVVVGAGCESRAWVALDTLVDVVTGNSVTAESRSASALESTNGVHADGIAVTVVGAERTFVDVKAVDSVSLESSVASTGE
jgi:hypothetical protein